MYWICLIILTLSVYLGHGQSFYKSNSALTKLVTETAEHAFQEFAEAKLGSNQLAITLVHLRNGEAPEQGSYRGNVPIYPASVVKMFYLAATHQWLEEGKLKDSDELRRACRDMIVDSYNEATHYVVDVLSGTTSGPELPPEEMKIWSDKRNVVNRYFKQLGYTNLNINQKPWCEGPYGRERIFVGSKFENRNALTTDATAHLLGEIARRRFISEERCEQMLKLMERDPFKKTPEPDQANDFIGKALPTGAKLWSKAGWTSTVRHDAASVEMPDGRRFVLVIFTAGHSKRSEIIPALARRIITELK